MRIQLLGLFTLSMLLLTTSHVQAGPINTVVCALIEDQKLQSNFIDCHDQQTRDVFAGNEAAQNIINAAAGFGNNIGASAGKGDVPGTLQGLLMAGVKWAYGKGDPHMTSFDGKAFDFMAVGEFRYVLIDDPAAPFEVQARQTSVNIAGSAIKAVAVKADGFVWEVYSGKQPGFYVGGNHVTLLPGQSVVLVKGQNEFFGVIGRNDYGFSYLDKHLRTVTVSNWGTYLDVFLSMPPTVAKTMQGVLGSVFSPLKFANGQDVPNEITQEQFFEFAAGFTVTKEQSLFQRTSYLKRDVNYPATFAKLDKVDGNRLAAATAKVKAVAGEGIPKIELDNCIFDVIFGQQDFLQSCRGNFSFATERVVIKD